LLAPCNVTVLDHLPVSLSSTDGNNNARSGCYVAFDIIGIILLLVGAIIAFVIACRDVYRSYALLIACAVLIPLGCLAYIIANACYWPKVNPSAGSWLLSALWSAFPPALTAIIYVCVRPDRIL
ncbi:hypothetical protein FBUS_03799, partial [Fasciolopsis buskii]